MASSFVGKIENTSKKADLVGKKSKFFLKNIIVENLRLQLNFEVKQRKGVQVIVVFFKWRYEIRLLDVFFQLI